MCVNQLMFLMKTAETDCYIQHGGTLYRMAKRVLRTLQQSYGNKIVSLEFWSSRSSELKFPDSYGGQENEMG